MKSQDIIDVLENGSLRVRAQLLDASNAAFLVEVLPRAEADPASAPGPELYGVYKPIRGEEPLWDFPTGHLAHREVACFLIDEAGGWGLVPPTALITGPLGPGSLQRWVTDAKRVLEQAGDPTSAAREPEAGAVRPTGIDTADLEAGGQEAGAEADIVRLLQPGTDLPGWLPVFTGELPNGGQVLVAHADNPRLRSLAVLDAVVNNSDRKASHVLRGSDAQLWGIDHGVTLHSQAKLRTVLWGWAGEPLPEQDLHRLEQLAAALTGGELPHRLAQLLTAEEITALRGRVAHLRRTRRHPLPAPGWPALPWPPL
ncbi:SCO1664 family protein [Gephyromycinifex aptenodytis]|uniref:SCO1664 family protein n=1 Tax=Gephyromycinifex aptenodytis TaxID=2716227 RepID=UPI001B2FE531|nr:SCO1664 family protein [Gephyromycinifex aptenodytis]